MSFSKLVFGESVIQGCQMVELKGRFPIFFLYLINNLNFYFANQATLSNGQLCLFRQIKCEIKKKMDYNQCEKDGLF